MTSVKNAPKKKYKFPKTIGECLKHLAKLRAQQLKLAAQLKPFVDEDAALREHLIETFTKEELKSARGSGIALSYYTTAVPVVEDPDKFMAFATKKKNWDLLSASCKSDAWRARLEAGKAVPGVTKYDRPTLSVRTDKGGDKP